MSDIDLRTDALLNWDRLDVNELPTGTVTLLLADVEGSTRLWETRPDDMKAALELLNRTVSDLVAGFDGVRPVEQGEGDSFVVAFARASDAVGCALELQRAELGPIRLRIGVHTGQIVLRDEHNYAGPTINRTARLRDLAHGGQTVLSGATEQLVADWLPAGCWLTSLGTHQLRDLPRPEQVVQLCHSDLRNEFPALRTAKQAVIHNLPKPLTRFIGRSDAIGQVRRLLGENRLVTLTGAGGIGKTRLATETAAQLLTEYPDGVRYVDLAPITHSGLVPGTVARALEVPEQPGISTIEAVTGFIGSRRLLVILDNCEHVLDPVAELAGPLLAACESLTLFATSREPIGVTGEVAWRVPSLTVDDEAIELFADRARHTRADFETTGEDRETVAEICRRLDGMPLAIELAAARARALSLSDIADGLRDRFVLLTGGARNVTARQQTLRASVDWSYALLSAHESELFRGLGVFLASFDLEAAHAITGDGDVPRFEVLDRLTLLVDKSLLIAENSSGRTRYRMLETMRQYALEKLGEAGSTAVVRARHCRHYMSEAALLDEPAPADFPDRIARADTDFDNMRAAFAWCRENAYITEALRLVASLQPVWLIGGWDSGRAEEGQTWYDDALRDAEEHLDAVSPAAYARALAERVVLDASLGFIRPAEQAQRALDIAREVDDPALLTRALFARGSIATDDPAARVCFAEALELAQARGDRWMACNILAWQAYTAYIAGEPLTGKAEAAQGRQLADAVGDGQASRYCRWTHGFAEILSGDIVDGIAALEQVAVDSHSAHDFVRWANCLFGQAHALVYMGQWEMARAKAEEAAGSGAGFGPVKAALVDNLVALACLAAGDLDASEKLSEDARVRLLDLGATASVLAIYPRAEMALARGDLTTARTLADEALATNPGCFRARDLCTRAGVALAQGEPGQAAKNLHDALDLAAQRGIVFYLPRTLELLASVMSITGSHLDAARLLGAAESVRQRSGEVRFVVHRESYEKTVNAVRNTLGDDVFETARAEGLAMSTNEAIACAQRGRGERKRPATGWDSLTPAEREVIRLLGEGLSNKDLATRLFISPRTVETHLSHVYTKLAVASRVQLIQEAARHT